MDEKEVILNIEVKYSDAIEGISKYQEKQKELLKINKEAEASFKAGSISQEDYQKTLIATGARNKEYQNNIRELNKEIQNNLKTEKEKEGSLRSLRAQLSNTTKAYDSLSRQERESAKGNEYLEKIKNITNELNEAEQASLRFYRNVGNYEESILNAATGGNQFAASLVSIAQQSSGAGGVIEVLTGKVKAFFAAVVANPVVAVFSSIVAVLALVKKGIDSNEEATRRWSIVLAPLNRILEECFKLVQELANDFLTLAEEIQSIIVWFVKLEQRLFGTKSAFNDLNESILRSINLQNESISLQNQQRQADLLSSKNKVKISELNAKIANQEKYTAEERLSFQKEIDALQSEEYKRRAQLAKQAYEQEKERQSITASNTQDIEKLLELERRMYDTETEYNNYRTQSAKQTTKINKQAESQANKIAAAATKAGGAAVKANEDYQKSAIELRNNEISAIRAYEDSLLSLVDNEFEKRRKAAEIASKRRIEDLKKMLDEGKNLTYQAATAIRKNIEAEAAILAKNIDDLRSEEYIKQSNAIETNLRNKLEIINRGSEEALDVRLRILEEQRKREVVQAEKAGTDVALINEKYRERERTERLKFEQQSYNRLLEEQRLYWANRITEAEIGSNSETDIIKLALQRAKEEYEGLRQSEGESDSLFLEKKRALNLKVIALEKELQEETRQMWYDNLNAVESFFNATSNLIDEFAEKNKALSIFSKGLALFEIGINSGKAISAGLVQAQSVPFPANIAAVATTLAAIATNIAKANKVVKAQKTPSYSVGGNVFGEGTGKSDSINANLSHGESVLTAKATSMFAPAISMFNQIGGGVPIKSTSVSGVNMGADILKDAFKQAMSELPPQYIAYSEFRRFSESVNVLEFNRKV